MKIGAIYVNGWAGPKNPQRAGVYIGRGQILCPDGSRADVTGNAAMVQACEPWYFDNLREGSAAADRLHGLARRYADEVLWPAKFGPVGDRPALVPPFEEWKRDATIGSRE